MSFEGDRKPNRPLTATEIAQPGSLYTMPKGTSPQSEAGEEILRLLRIITLEEKKMKALLDTVSQLLTCIQHAATCSSIACIHSYARLLVDKYEIEPLAHAPDQEA